MFWHNVLCFYFAAAVVFLLFTLKHKKGCYFTTPSAFMDQAPNMCYQGFVSFSVDCIAGCAQYLSYVVLLFHAFTYLFQAYVLFIVDFFKKSTSDLCWVCLAVLQEDIPSGFLFRVLQSSSPAIVYILYLYLISKLFSFPLPQL